MCNDITDKSRSDICWITKLGPAFKNPVCSFTLDFKLTNSTLSNCMLMLMLIYAAPTNVNKHHISTFVCFCRVSLPNMTAYHHSKSKSQHLKYLKCFGLVMWTCFTHSYLSELSLTSGYSRFSIPSTACDCKPSKLAFLYEACPKGLVLERVGMGGWGLLAVFPFVFPTPCSFPHPKMSTCTMHLLSHQSTDTLSPSICLFPPRIP